MEYSGKTTSFRELNQDNFATGEGLWDKDSGYLFVVCDGLSDFKQAHFASLRATETIISKFYSTKNTNRLETLIQVVETVNVELYKEFREKPEVTTLVAALIHQDQLHIAHVGDSRAYLIKDGKIVRLTTDHTLFEEVIKRGIDTREDLQKRPHNCTSWHEFWDMNILSKLILPHMRFRGMR
jgi:serine/threonine protein phosphatase PrpC